VVNRDKNKRYKIKKKNNISPPPYNNNNIYNLIYNKGIPLSIGFYSIDNSGQLFLSHFSSNGLLL